MMENDFRSMERTRESRLANLLNNQHYAPASYLARLTVNFATILWSLVTLTHIESTGYQLYLYHRQLRAVMPIEYWASIGLLAASFGVFRLFRKSRPTWWGAMGYALQMLFWIFVAAACTMVDLNIMSPASVSGIITTAFLSIYAAASNSIGGWRESIR